MAGDGVVHCVVESSWQSENVTLATAERDLDEGAAVLRSLMLGSSEFSAAVANRTICYELVEDYGMGSITICSRSDKGIEWGYSFPRSSG